MSTKRQRRAIKLEASDEVLYYPDNSFNDGTVVALLDECYEKNVPQNRLVLVTSKVRDMRYKEWGEDWTYRDKMSRVPRSEIEGLWRCLDGVSPDSNYTPENEIARLNWNEKADKKIAARCSLRWGLM